MNKHFRRMAAVLVGAVFLLPACMAIQPYREYTAESVRSEYGERKLSFPLPAKGKQQMPPTGGRLELPLSLEAAVNEARRRNPDLRRTLVRISQARAMSDLADAAFQPAVRFYGEYMQGDAPSAYLFKTIDQRRLPPNLNFNDPGWFENVEAGLEARMNLFNGGRDYLGWRMARLDVEMSVLDKNTAANTLTGEVIQAFYDVLAAEKYVRIAEESVRTVAEQVRLMQVRVEGGGALKSDLLSLKVRLAQSEESVVRTKNRFALAKAALSSLMGLDPEALSTVPEPLVEPEQMLAEAPATHAESLLIALAKRPELEKMRQQLVKSRMALTAARTHYLPRLDLMGKYYLDDSGLDFDRDRENWTAALMFRWDLYTGMSTAARVNAARAALREMLAAEDKAVLDIKMDVKNAYLNRRAAAAARRAAERAAVSAEESYRMVARHYKGGAATVTRYLNAQLDRNQARIGSTAAHYAEIKAIADLARATGYWAGRQTPAEKGINDHEKP